MIDNDQSTIIEASEVYKSIPTDMSMTWMGCLNHNLTHTTSEKPRESPTTTTVTVRPSRYISVRLHPYDPKPQ